MSSGAGSEDNLPEMAKFDHRHLQMWRWLHSSNGIHHRSTTTNTNTDTSMESSMSNSFDFSADMSRSIDSSISSSRILASPMPITNFVTPPSTSFGNAATGTIHDIYSLALPYLQAPPLPYTPAPGHAHNHAASTLLLLHKMATDAAASTSEQPSEESSEDIDVVGLSLNDKDEEEEQRELAVDTQPLDLSYKLTQPTSSPTPSGSAFRPTVIIDHHSSGSNETSSSKTHTCVRRSMSSVSSTNTHEDVAAHFRRSLSGKWPKKCNKYEENRNSPLRRRTSFNTHSSISSLSTLSISPTPPTPQPTPTPSSTTTLTPPKPNIINHCSDTSLSVADHFRRALFGKKGAYDLMKSQKL